MASVVAWCEFLGGILLLAGLFTRFVAAVLSIILTVALLTAHRTALMAFDMKGIGLAFICLGGMLALKILGGGPLSLDRVIFKKKHHEEHKKKD
jgi:putative oxidoreductase